MDKKILFVHIPKTAGTSVRVFLEKNNLNSWLRNESSLHHDTYLQLKDLNSISDAFAFTICRNPYTRAFSYYNHFKRVNNEPDTSFVHFLNLVKEKTYFYRTPFIQYDQSYFLEDEKKEIAKIKIYRFEKLGEFETDFSVKLPKLNSSKFKIKDYLNAYDENTTKDLVQTIYKRDFVNFNYSIKFESSIVDLL